MRRIRAMLRTAAVWGAAWSVPGLIWISVLAFLQRDSSPHVGLSGFALTVLLNWTVVGAISGAAFALVLSLAERRQISLSALSMPRVVSWGAIGGAVLPLMVIPLLPLVASDISQHVPALQTFSAALRQAILAGTIYGALGAVSAGASLHLARRADRRRAEPETGRTVAP